MREIKFRMYDYDNDKYIYNWQDTIYAECFCFDGSLDRVRFKKNPEQYTGLKDKNGKEIYEGDILKVRLNEESNAISKVAFKKGMFICDSFHVYEITHESEIIGNISENMNLILDARCAKYNIKHKYQN